MKREVIFLIVLLLFIGSVSASYMPIYVTPLSSTGNIFPGQSFLYQFNWTTNGDCSGVVFNSTILNITMNSAGVGFVNLSVPDSLSSMPVYLCEYRGQSLPLTLRTVHNLSNQFFNQIYTQNLNVSNNVYGGFLFGNGAGVTNVNASLLGGYPASYFFPLNNTIGNVTFNNGVANGGVSIAGGNIFAQQVFAVNFSGLTITNLSINGSLIPEFLDNSFNIGSPGLRWANLYLGGNLYSNGTLYESGQTLASRYLQTAYATNNTFYPYSSNPLGFYNSTNPPPASGVSIGTLQSYFGNGTNVNTTQLFSFGYYNSTNPPPATGGNPFDQVLNTTSNVTHANLSLTGNLSVDLNTLFVNSNTNQVGIGTATPQNPLNVIGAINGTTVYSGNNNLTIAYLYATNGTFALSSSTISIGTLQNYFGNGTNVNATSLSSNLTFYALNTSFNSTQFNVVGGNVTIKDSYVTGLASGVSIGTLQNYFGNGTNLNSSTFTNSSQNYLANNLTAVNNISGQTVFSAGNNLTKSYLYATNGTYLLNGYAGNNTWLFNGYASNNTWLLSAYAYNNTYGYYNITQQAINFNITSVFNVTNQTVSLFLINASNGNITVANNISANAFIGSGAFLTGIPSIATLQSYFGNGTNLNSSIFTNSSQNYLVNNLTAIGNVSGQTVFTQGNLNLTIAYLYATNSTFDFKNNNPFNQVLNTTSNVSFANVTTTGNVSATNFIGSGSLLTGIPSITTIQNYFGNGTNYNSSNYLNFFNATNGFLNSTLNITIGNLTAINNISAAIINGTTVYSGNSNVTNASLYVNNGSFIMSGTTVSIGTLQNYFGNGTNLNSSIFTNSSQNYLVNNLTAVNNISATTFYGSGAQLTGIPSIATLQSYFGNGTNLNSSIFTNSSQNYLANNLTAVNNISGQTVFSAGNNLTKSYLYATNGTYLLNGYAGNNTWLFNGYASNNTWLLSAYAYNNTYGYYNITQQAINFNITSVFNVTNQTANLFLINASNGNITVANNISANAFIGSGAFLTGISSIATIQNYFANGTNVNATSLSSNLTFYALNTSFNSTQFNVVGSNVTIKDSYVTGLASGVSIGTLQNYFGNGTNLNSSAFTNSSQNYLVNNLTAVNNISATTFYGSGAQLTGIPSIATIQNYFGNGTNVNTTQLNSTQFTINATNISIKDSYITGLASGVSIATLQSYFGNGTNLNSSIFTNSSQNYLVNNLTAIGNVSGQTVFTQGNLNLTIAYLYATNSTFDFKNNNPFNQVLNTTSNVSFANVTATGNVSATTFYGSGAQLTGIPSIATIQNYFGNGTNVNTTQLNSTQFTINATNISIKDSYITGLASGVSIATLQSYFGNGTNLNSSIFTNSSQNYLVNNLTAIGNVSGQTVFTQGNLNLTIAYLYATNSTFDFKNNNPFNQVLNTTSNVSFANVTATGNVSATTFYGSGAQLTGIPSIATIQNYFGNGTNVNTTQLNSTQFTINATNISIKDSYITGLASGVSIATLQSYFGNGTNLNSSIFTNSSQNYLVNNLTAIGNVSGQTVFTQGNLNLTIAYLYATNSTFDFKNNNPFNQVLNTTSNVSFANVTATGNVSATTFYGSGAQLTGIPSIATIQNYFGNGTNVNTTQLNSTQFTINATNISIKDSYITGLASGVSIATLQSYFGNGTNLNSSIFTNSSQNYLVNNLTAIGNVSGQTVFTQGNLNLTIAYLYATNSTFDFKNNNPFNQVLNTTSNVSFANVTATGNVSATTFYGSGAQLTGIPSIATIQNYFGNGTNVNTTQLNSTQFTINATNISIKDSYITGLASGVSIATLQSYFGNGTNLNSSIFTNSSQNYLVNNLTAIGNVSGQTVFTQGNLNLTIAYLYATNNTFYSAANPPPGGSDNTSWNQTSIVGNVNFNVSSGIFKVFNSTGYNLIQANSTSVLIGYSGASSGQTLEVNGSFGVENSTGFDAFRVSSNGGVGVNTTNPQQTFNVVGVANFTSVVGQGAFNVYNATGTQVIDTGTINSSGIQGGTNANLTYVTLGNLLNFTTEGNNIACTSGYNGTLQENATGIYLCNGNSALTLFGASSASSSGIANGSTAYLNNFNTTGLTNISNNLFVNSTNVVIGNLTNISTTVNATLQLWNANTIGAAPSIILGGALGGDTDFWLARTSNNDNLSNDVLQIGTGFAPGVNTLFTLNNSGWIGIGNVTTPDSNLLSIEQSFNGSNGVTDRMVHFLLNYTGSAAGTSNIRLGAFNLNLTGPFNVSDARTLNVNISDSLPAGFNVTNLTAIQANVNIFGGGNITNATALYAVLFVNGSGNITQWYMGVQVDAPIFRAGSLSRIANAAGLWVDNQGNANTTNAYGLYINNQTSATNNYAIITGNNLIGFNTTTPNQLLTVAGGNVNVTQGNVTVNQSYGTCYTQNCSAYISYNGTGVVIFS